MRNVIVVTLVFFCTVQGAFAQTATPAVATANKEITLSFDPSQTVARIVLPATMHTVEGEFAFKRGTLQFDPGTAKITGEIVFDATSGKTGNSTRDHKMHQSVLESQRYPEIRFQPSRVEGAVKTTGNSSVQVHGAFAIHGEEHDVTIPMQVSFNGDSWTGKGEFPVPFVKWGMKSPNSFFLHVDDTVQVKIEAGGRIGR
jgi:polyisoprenoid-binding protein YceI